MSKKKPQSSLGSSLKRRVFNQPRFSNQNLKSVTQQEDLDDFLCYTDLSNRDFTKEQTFEKSNNFTSKLEFPFILSIPRRPKWSPSISTNDFDAMEKESFLKWRRHLALLEKNESDRVVITPFERNIEVWKQLWRVVEMSDLIIQVVDARNPLFFISSDLFKYVQEVDPIKKHVILINKADLLSDDLIDEWSRYFVFYTKYSFIFYSNVCSSSRDKIMTSDKLYEYLCQNCKVSGFVGYPNVGKSSTINMLLNCKKASVSAYPGKTKHYQTFIKGEIKIVDCPGLVFPNFASSKEELVINGVLPIDHLRDFIKPIQLLTTLLTKEFFESFYHINLVINGDQCIAYTLLEALAKSKGFMTSGFGNLDIVKAARIILKDFVNGNIIFCTQPPS